MSRLRIRCKAPSTVMPSSFLDVDVCIIGADGAETKLTNVSAITWRVRNDGEQATATLEFTDVDVEVDAEASQ